MKTLVAGIGNIFLGDDGFGVEVVRRFAARQHEDVRAVDFGIRGLDLAYALLEHERVILVDAMPRGGTPGTLYVVEPEFTAETRATLDVHTLAPAQAFAAARAMGATLQFVRIVGCEPAEIPDLDELAVGLSAPVAAAVDGAVSLIEQLLETADA